MKHPTLFIVLISALLAGCQSMPTPAPGLAAIRIHVVAEAKAGYTSPADRAALYDSPGDHDLGSGAFQRVDYSGLDEIVVWVEPVTAQAKSDIAPASIDVAAKKSALAVTRAVSVGQQLIVRNIASQAANFYSVSDGNEFDLGSIPAGGQKSYAIRSTGLIEILNDSSKDPVAEVYAAPSRWVSLARSGSSVDFTNLPPGQYKLASWHPRLPGYETILTLSPDQIAAATIKVGVNALPKVGPR
jgi:hypothetical protein